MLYKDRLWLGRLRRRVICQQRSGPTSSCMLLMLVWSRIFDLRRPLVADRVGFGVFITHDSILQAMLAGTDLRWDQHAGAIVNR